MAGPGSPRPGVSTLNFREMRFFNFRFTFNTAGDAFPVAFSFVSRFQSPHSCRDRESGPPPEEGELVGAIRSEIQLTLSGAEQGVEPNSPPQGVRIRANSSRAPLLSSAETTSVRQPGKSANGGRGLHPSMPVVHDPEDQGRRPLRLPGCRFLGEIGLAKPGSIGDTATSSVQNAIRMTLCGSEVPQDRWRGRTAGSGMWTRTMR